MVGLRRWLVEGHRVVAAGHLTEVGDEGVSEVEPASACAEGGSNHGFLVDPELPGVQQALDQLGTPRSADLVGASLTW